MGIFDGVIGGVANSYNAYTGIDDLIHEAAMNGDEKNPFVGLTIEEAVQRISYENAQNLANITKAMAFTELAEYINTGRPYVYTEGALSDVWGKIKSFFVKLWNKLKEFFKRLWMRVSSMFMKKDAWAKKYKKEIAKAKIKEYGSGFKFSGYKYSQTSMQLDMSADNVADPKILDFDVNDAEVFYQILNNQIGANKLAAKLKALKDADKDELRGKTRASVYKANIDNSCTDTELDEDEFKTKLIERLRGGDEDKDEFDDIASHVRQAESDLLEGYKSFKKIYDKALKKISHKCDKIIKDLDKVANDLSKNRSLDTEKEEIAKRATEHAKNTTHGRYNSAQFSDEFASTVASRRNTLAEYIHLFSETWQMISTTYTEMMGTWTKEYNQWMNQSQSLLIKAIGHKKSEKEDYHESDNSYVNGDYIHESSNSFLNGVELI